MPSCSETRLRLLALFLLATVGSGAPAAFAALEWRFSAERDVAAVHNFTHSRIGDGALRGVVGWDPYVYLQVPPEGIDAAALHYLEVRLYSSAPADLLDIYYQCPNGEWGLMGKFAIQRGWATYRLDLNTCAAHESSAAPASARWGGSEQRVVSFRIDPGNDADRQVLLSHVRLTDEPLAEGITQEPFGTMRTPRVQAPRQTQAGEMLRVSVTFQPLETPPSLATARAYVRLMRGATVLGDREQLIDVRERETVVAAEFPTSRYMSAGAVTVCAGVYELNDSSGTGPALARIDLQNPRQATQRPPQVDVRRLGGDPTIHVEGKPLAGMTFLVGDGRHLARHKEFAEAGIHVYSDWFGTSGAGDLGHRTEDEYDYSGFDAYFVALLDADPEAWFLPHLYVTPPAWWQAQNPQELCVYSDGTRGPQSFGSEKWRTEMGDDLRRLLVHLQSSVYADRILGYILCSGHSAEWQEWGIWNNKWADYSEPSRRAFRAWLRTHYGTDAALQAAWRDPAASLDGAELPALDARTTATAGVLRDPTREQHVIDFYQYLSETMAASILHFARIVKDATGGRSLAGAYYGYLTQHGIHQQDSAHLALARVLESPDIDFLMSPPVYTGREIGGTSTFMTASASVKLHGKLWINESDIRTHLTDPGAGYGRVQDLAESRAVLWREFGEMLARRTAISWFDMAGGWFSDRTLLADLAAMRALADRAMEVRQPFQADMAVFISAESAYRMRPADVWTPAVLEQVVSLPRVGVPADLYLLSDLNRPDLPEYKVYVFLNACYVDAATRCSVDEKVKRRGATSVWIFAPGAVTDEGLSAASMKAVTGINLVAAFDQTAPLQIQIPGADPIGWNAVNGPVFWADDASAETLGTLLHNGQPGLVRRQADGWTSIYYATVGMPPALLRQIARAAGAHVYLETDDALDTDGQFACVHARTAGDKTLHLPRPAKIVDVMANQILSRQAATVTLTMQAGETALLQMLPPD